MTVPAVTVLIAFEHRPRMIADFASDGEEHRFREWVDANPHIRAILEAVVRAREDDELRRPA